MKKIVLSLLVVGSALFGDNLSDAESYYETGLTYQLKNEYALAIKDYTKSIKLSPNYVDAYFYRASSYGQLEDFPSAIKDFSKVIALNPNYDSVYYNRGLAYQLNNNYPSAIKDYTIDITLPEFMCKCPRSGYPDFATIYLSYSPASSVIELKALKLYINSFMNRYISHENGANEIFDTLERNLKPKWIKVVADYKPRGNVHTVITIDSRENGK